MNGVWVCPFFEPGLPDGGCGGPFERHHCIPKQTIKNNHSWLEHLRSGSNRSLGKRGVWQDRAPDPLPTLEQALADPRNLVAICQQHHERVSNRRIYVTRSMLPAGIDEFAEELGLVWYMDRYFDREEGAA